MDSSPSTDRGCPIRLGIPDPRRHHRRPTGRVAFLSASFLSSPLVKSHALTRNPSAFVTSEIFQIVETIEALLGFETKNKYSLKNANGQQVYYAAEQSSCPMRSFCGGNRAFSMHIVDNFQRVNLFSFFSLNIEILGSDQDQSPLQMLGELLLYLYGRLCRGV